MNNQEANNGSIYQEQESIAVNDLAVNEEQEAQVKGGPIVLKDVMVSSYQLSGSGSNHNETISADNEADTQKLADLTVDNETEAEVKGGIGMLVPAVQKVREAAARSSSSGMSAGKVSYSDLS